MSKLFTEIRRRKVFQTFVPYLGIVWLLLQVVSVVTPMFDLSPLFNTLVAVVLFAGMPVMLYLSWYFDFTAEGLVAIPDAKTNNVLPFGLSNWAVLLLITVGSGALAYGYFSELQIKFAKSQDGIQQVFIADSIAVLPFKDASSDQDQGFIAQGLAEEITSLLGRTAGLKVAASSSSSTLAAKSLDPVTIARRLAVSTVLTGSVRVTGDQLKIRVELINAGDAKVLWSETFARKFSDIFSVEAEIARSTVNMLQDTYIETGSLTNSATTKSTDAYVIYLKGREQYRKQTTESMKEARKLFEQAIGLDPEYAQAYVALADTIVLLAEGPERFGVLKTDIAARLAKEYLEKAVVRQPNIPEAYAVFGYIPFMLGTPEESLPFFDKAIRLNPSLALAHLWKSQALKVLQRHDESLQEMELASELDPLSVAVMHNLGFKYTERGLYDNATSIYMQLITEYPNSPFGYAGLADAAFSNGDYALSLKYWKGAIEISPEDDDYKKNYISCLFNLGLTEQLKQVATDPIYQSNILLLENRYEELFNLLDFQLEARPEDYWATFEAGWFNLLLGNSSKGERQLQLSSEIFDQNELYNMPYCSPAIEFAWLNFKLEHVEKALEQINFCKKKLDAELANNVVHSELFYLASRLAVLSNNNQIAIEQLRLAVKNGWREWWTGKDPLFESLRELPEFKQQIKIIKDDLAKQRLEALKLFAE